MPNSNSSDERTTPPLSPLPTNSEEMSSNERTDSPPVVVGPGGSGSTKGKTGANGARHDAATRGVNRWTVCFNLVPAVQEFFFFCLTEHLFAYLDALLSS